MKKLLKDPVALICLIFIAVIFIMGIAAPVFALHDPFEQDIMNKFAASSTQFPFGTDNLGRCVYSRLVYGIRTTVFLSLFTMSCTVAMGTLLGLLAGYFKGFVDELIMRICDVMLSFPSQVMILAIVGILGVGIENVVLANIVIKWAWYARMIRGFTINYRYKNYMLYSRTIGTSRSYVLFQHILPNILSEIIILASLDMGWVIINISTLSFLGLGVQPPHPEWGAMLSEAKNIMHSKPQTMLPAGLCILSLVVCFNLLGDSLRDALDPKGSKL